MDLAIQRPTLKSCVDSCNESLPSPNRLNEGIIARIGAAGTSKSHSTLEYLKGYLTHANIPDAPLCSVVHTWEYGETFQNYQDHTFIHLPEFGGRSSMKLELFKRMCNIGYTGADSYCTLPVKNGTPSNINVAQILMDSNICLTKMYKKCFEDNPAHWSAFIRRFAIIKWYPHVRLTDNPTSCFDFLLSDAGDYICNKFNAESNPNPSYFNIEPEVRHMSYTQACKFFERLEDQVNLIGRTRRSLNNQQDLTWASLHDTHKLIDGKPHFVRQAEVTWGVAFNDVALEHVIVGRLLAGASLPTMTYHVESSRWTVSI